MSENSEKRPLWFPRAQGIQIACFNWPAVQNPEIFSLLSYMTKKSMKLNQKPKKASVLDFCLEND